MRLIDFCKSNVTQILANQTQIFADYGRKICVYLRYICAYLRSKSYSFSFVNVNRRDNKGVILISVYVVVLIISTLSVALLLQMSQELRLIRRDISYTQALYEAEKGIAYAYFEAINGGYTWHTHEWDAAKTTLQPVASPTSVSTDCQFDADGYYVPINSTLGDFRVMAYPDPNKPSITILRSLGRSGQIERGVEYRASKRGIYDFYFYTPYALDLASLASWAWDGARWIRTVNADGGGIHTNQDIYFNQPLLMKDCYELSTPKNIYYTSQGQYVRPYSIDALDGVDGRTPAPTLHKRTGFADNVPGYDRIWQSADGGPWGYYWTSWDGKKYWNFKSYGWETGTGWPPRAYQNVDTYFTGDSKDENKVWVDSATGKISASGDIQLNQYNVWIKPYKLDDDGNPLTTKYTEFPAELDELWSWDKYRGSPPGSEVAPTKLYTRGLNEDGSETENIGLGAANDHWRLKKVGASWNVYHSVNPGDPSYFQMLQDPEYWMRLGYSPDGRQAKYINPELFDGDYGDDLENIGIKNLNSLKQENAWKEFLEKADVGLSDGLKDIVMDGNTGGEDLEPPSFSETYWRKAKNFGLYIGIPGEPDAPPTKGETDKAKIETAIDAAVTILNNNPEGITVAKKVSYISAQSGQKEYLLEIDVGAMDAADIEPGNGIIYSRLPIRLSNAAVLPQKAGGFTLLSEKGITIKGDFNYERTAANPREKWLKAALVSRMAVTTVSNNYTDAQYLPALTHYLNYPYLNVADLAGIYEEVKLRTAGSFWAHLNYLAVDNGYWDWVKGVWVPPDGKPDYYTNIPMDNQKVLKDRIIQKDTDYRNIFLALGNDPNTPADYIEPLGNDTVKNWGRMIQPADQNYYYNSLISSYWTTTNPGVDENWSARTRTIKGSFIRLDTRDMNTGGFTAPGSEFPPFDNRGRSASGSISSYIGAYSTSPWTGYDREFHTAARSPADIFFASAEPVWQEFSPANFPNP